MQKFFRNNVVNTSISAILVLGVALVVFSPGYLIVKWGANYAMRILFAYLFLGFVFLIFNQKRLMVISLFSAAALAIFLKMMTNSDMKRPEPIVNQAVFKVAHFNVNNSNESYEATLSSILSTEADLISIQETNPVWDSILLSNLGENYPHHFSQPSLSLFGMTIFSKKPFAYADTIRYKEIPNIIGGIALDDKNTLNFICSHTLPALNYRYYDRLKEHLDCIADYSNKISEPMMAFGDYNSVPWSNEIAEFKEKTGMKDSRRGFTPTFPHGSSTVFEVPIDHIFFSDEIRCLDFSTVSSIYTKHMGVQGTFQLNGKEKEDVEEKN